MNVQIAPSWKLALNPLFEKPYFAQIAAHLKTERALHKTIYPKGSQIFNAFEQTHYDDVKVVILKELKTDTGTSIPSTGNLTPWAQQGVLLLNAVLTVRENEPASHSKIGWMNFTDDVIKHLSDQKSRLVFILWGNFAIQKQILIDATKHKILKAAHPSPLSAYNGFFGCKHFSATNDYLVSHNKTPINWAL